MVGRSLELVSFRTSGVAAGEIVVADRFGHPRRGTVRCPTAPLLAELACGLGFRARVAGVHAAEAEKVAGDAVVCAMSYLDHDGRPAGSAVAARIADEHGRAAARDLIGQWSSAVRTRRLLLAVSETGGETERAVASVAASARGFALLGDTVLVVGSPEPAAAVVACARRAEVRAAAPDRPGSLSGIDPDRVSYVVAPETPVEEAAETVKALRRRFPRLRGPHPREFGYAASDRREAVRSVAAASDVLLICGPEGAWAGEELLGWAGGICPAHRVGRLADLRAGWLSGAATVGMAVAGPAGTEIAEEVATALSGLGPLAVVRRRVVTEPLRGAGEIRPRTGIATGPARQAAARQSSAALYATARAAE
ncbi:hypothetical protein [Amycolatopsis sp. NPDC004079]|uniref:hypothetical protein n=1 Tax=Amycolatopsis sp. NPDC004079 TaxID=3154549 RepID=UPI0033ADE938